jgi:hypothetical protein
MNSQQQPHQTEEIDLGYFFKQITNFFKGIVNLGFMMLSFFKKYIIWIVLIIIFGATLGYFLEKTSNPMYQNKLIVIPNFESTDYLYEEVEAFNLKIKQKDSTFIKEFTGENWKNLKAIKIEAIPDIYNFITTSREHIDVFRVLFENQEMSEFVEDIITSKQYKYHKLNFYIIGDKTKIIDDKSQKIIEKIIAHINANDHYKKYQKASLDNTIMRIAETDKTVNKINAILDGFAVIPEPGTNQMPQVNANSDMSEIAELKGELLEDRLKLTKKQIDQQQIINTVSAKYNILDNGIFSFSKTIKYPIILVLLFSFVFFIIY